MPKKMPQKILVILEEKIKKKPSGEYRKVIAPESLRSLFKNLEFLGLDSFISPESSDYAFEILKKICSARDETGALISEKYSWKGYKLWWLFYSELFFDYALPYTRYHHLIDFVAQQKESKIFIFITDKKKIKIFQAFSHKVIKIKTPFYCKVKDIFKTIYWWGNNSLQIALTLISLLFLLFKKIRIGIITFDFFWKDKPWDFRFHGVYEEMHKRKLDFLEVIHSKERPGGLLKHFIRRKCPSLYTQAIIRMAKDFCRLNLFLKGCPPLNQDVKNPYVRLASSLYPEGIWPMVISIQIIKFIFKLAGLKALFAYNLSERTMLEIIASKELEIKTVGITHGMPIRKYTLWEFYEFLPEKYTQMSQDYYGVWSQAWYDYYLKYSKVFDQKNLEVAGYLHRSLLDLALNRLKNMDEEDNKIKVLWISEPHLPVDEAIPYIEKLLEHPRISLSMKIRPMYKDYFWENLCKKMPELKGKLPVFQDNVFEALASHQVVVGSCSTGVIDALLVDKPFIMVKTKKFGDCFSLVGEPRSCTQGRGEHKTSQFFAENPNELISLVLDVHSISLDAIKNLSRFFYGDLKQDGARWVVDKLEGSINPVRKDGALYPALSER